MIDYGLKDRVALITGANNPWGIGATTANIYSHIDSTSKRETAQAIGELLG